MNMVNTSNWKIKKKVRVEPRGQFRLVPVFIGFYLFVTLLSIISSVSAHAADSAVSDLSRKAGETNPPDMISVPGDRSEMGDSGWTRMALAADDGPYHNVTLTAYEIGKFEITNAQLAEVYNWAYNKGYVDTIDVTTVRAFGQELIDLNAVNGAGGTMSDLEWNGTQLIVETRSSFSMDTFPVVEISWFGAAAYCNWLSEKEGLEPVYDTVTWRTDFTKDGYHLPTEAQWERAAAWNSGTKTHFTYGNSGNNLGAADANFGFVVGGPRGLGAQPYIANVGYYDGNAAGISDSKSPVLAYDMSGNVSEWVNDWYVERYYTMSRKVDPVGPPSGMFRVHRGGSWYSDVAFCVTSRRDFRDPVDTDRGIGFRVARSIGYRAPSIAPEMAKVVTAGSFPMGSDNAVDFGPDATPEHPVMLSDYEIGLFEISNQQVVETYNWAYGKRYFDALSETNAIAYGKTLTKVSAVGAPATGDIKFNNSDSALEVQVRNKIPTGNLPTVFISWYGAAAYCNWLSERVGLAPVYDTSTSPWSADFSKNGYHLPTEAQWERAAAWDGSLNHYRYGTSSSVLIVAGVDATFDSIIPLELSGLAGGPIATPVGYFDEEREAVGPIRTKTSPVKAFDMSGNVFEWVHDWYDNAYYGNIAENGNNPSGPASGPGRVYRGGGSSSGAANCTTGNRFLEVPENITKDDRGFRVARSSLAARPSTTTVAPAAGPVGGGTALKITGTDFTGADRVRFERIDSMGVVLETKFGANVTVVSATEVTCDTPLMTLGGTASVTVLHPTRGSSSGNITFDYVGVAPNLSAIAPTTGPIAGGTSVRLTGTNLTGVTKVSFAMTTAGATETKLGANVTIVSATELTCETPAMSQSGPATVTVEHPTNGTSSGVSFDFTDFHTADGNGDGKISDFELLAYIDLWKKRSVDDFSLLAAIDIWKKK